MRFFKVAALLGLTAATLAVAVPERRSPSDVTEVIGIADNDHASISFNTSCPGCFVGTDDRLELNLVVPKSHGECIGPNPILNGISLDQRWQGGMAHGRGQFPVQLFNGLGEREISVSWKAVCVRGEGQVLSVRILQVVDGGRVKDASGFTASFKQEGTPKILRLNNKPNRLDVQCQKLRSWLYPTKEQQLQINGSNLNASSSLDAEFAKLAEIKREMAILHAIMFKQERTIIKMLEKDFKQCEGIQCMLQTAMQKAPDFVHLITEHFSHGKFQLKNDDSFNEVAFVETLDLPEPPQTVGPTKENPAPPASLPFDGENHPNHPHKGDHPNPPFDGEHHHQPFEGDHPHSPFRGDHPPPPFHGEHPPLSDHKGSSSPPHDGYHHHPPHHGYGSYGALGRHHHSRPSFFQYIRHGRFRILKATAVLLAGCFLTALLFKTIRTHAPCFKDPRRRAERASRREERRTRCQFRRAAHRHRLSSWWAAHNPRRKSAAGTADYDEKRILILQQEGILEAAMQNEIRNLEMAADLEEGRSRAHVARAGPHELNGQPRSSRLNERQNYAVSVSDYSAPPPRYEAELDDDMMVVDGFGYTPSNTDETSESSIIDLSPRMSCDTLYTNSTKSD